MKSTKRGIALLITVMFVGVISIAIGYALKQINEASSYVEEENNLYQNFIFVEDVLNILNNSAELQNLVSNDAPEDLFNFLNNSGFITFEYSGIRLVLHISSARRTFAINDLTKEQEVYLYDFFARYNVRGEYIDILKDSISGIKEDNYYHTTLFDKHPELFRDYIASFKHLKKLNDFYEEEYRDKSMSEIKFEDLFYLSSEQNTSIDLNYVTPEVLELMTGMNSDQAKVLSSSEILYTSLESFYKSANLNEEQKKRLKQFHTSFFEPYLNIKMDIIKDNIISHISFEYDIKNKRGYNFVYEI